MTLIAAGYSLSLILDLPTLERRGLCRSFGASSTPGLVECARQPVSELLAIGRFLVKPQAHAYGIARHLLKESRTYSQRPKLNLLDARAFRCGITYSRYASS